jgi:hypothetical protein
VVGIKHNNRKENCTGSEDVMRDHRCAHLAPSLTSLARTSVSCVAIATRTSTGVACSPALEVPPPRGFGDAAAFPHKGPAADRGTSATARRGNGVAATVKGKCALGPFLSILVIECQHKCLNVNLCPWMDKVQINRKGMFLSLSTLVLCTNILV